jgi:hypothetical protein
MERKRVYALADQYTSQDRNTQYGSPENNFGTIASMWAAYLAARPDPNAPVDAGDVAAMLSLVKLARIANNKGKGDSWVDLAGYAACGAEVSHASDPEGDLAVGVEPQKPFVSKESRTRLRQMPYGEDSYYPEN